MTDIIKIVLIILAIASISIFLFLLAYSLLTGETSGIFGLGKEKVESSKNPLDNLDNPLEDETGPENLNEVSSSGGESSGGGGGETGSVPNSKPLPEDLHQRPCGFYAEEYEACAGYCPTGECTTEGRSCYCKE